MGWDNNFYTLSFCARGEGREKERELAVGASMEGEF
jgi:hypothetical protein